MTTTKRFPFRVHDAVPSPVDDATLAHYSVQVVKDGLSYAPVTTAVVGLGGGRHLLSLLVDDADADYRAFVASTVSGNVVVQQELVAVPGGADEVLAVYEGDSEQLAPPTLWAGTTRDLMVRLRRPAGGAWDVSLATGATLEAARLDAFDGPAPIDAGLVAFDAAHGLADWAHGLLAVPLTPADVLADAGDYHITVALTFAAGAVVVLDTVVTVRPRAAVAP